MVTAVMEKIAERGVRDTARKIFQHVNGIFLFAKAHGKCSENPAAAVRETLRKNPQQKPRPAFLKFDELGDVLRSAEVARLSPTVRLAHRLLAFTAVRISNVAKAEWPEFDLDAETPTRVIPRRKMKARDRQHDHKVVLGPTIASELRAWRSMTSGKGYVFPSPAGGKHITRESLEKAYRVTLSLEDKHTPHGWRAAFSALARDHEVKTKAVFERDVVELALDHVHDNEVVRAYDRGERLAQRAELMNWWDAHLTQAERGAGVTPIRKTAA
jgi:integrase